MSTLGIVFSGELVGTMLLILLGNGVVYNVISPGTKGTKGGIIAIAVGWALAVLLGVTVAKAVGSPLGHINPAVSMASLIQGGISKNVSGHHTDAGVFFAVITAQLIGAMIGQIILDIIYWNHARSLGANALGAHSTSPTHPGTRNAFINVASEYVGTMVLLIAAIVLSSNKIRLPSVFDNGFLQLSLPVVAVLAIGLSLGGTTGYAINPARDLGPRLVYSVLHIVQGTQGRVARASQWRYALIPVVSPLLAGVTIGLIMMGL